MSLQLSNEIAINEIEFLSETPELSEEERLKARLVGELVEAYANEKIKSGAAPDSLDYGELFDRFYDKSIAYLLSMKFMYKKV